MIADISYDGKLIIHTENETESFALTAWNEKSEGYKVIFKSTEVIADDMIETAIICILNTTEQIEASDMEDEARDGVEE